ncbi:MAG: PEP-CTERM sorting domain-containing protein [Pirellulales bacterium]
MKLSTWIPAALAIALATTIGGRVIAATVAPYTEQFPTDAAQWLNGDSSGFGNFVPSGGPDGSSHISASLNTQAFGNGVSRVVFRGNSTTTPSIHASGDKFVGDWLGGGINRFSAWVYHEAEVPLPFFARFASVFGFPATAAINGTIVQPNTWTQLNFVINPGQIGTTLFPETDVPDENLSYFNQTFSNPGLGRIQIGFNVPASMANSPTSFVYRLDQVSVNTPEPATMLMIGIAAGVAVLRRRRRD